jgi:Nif-specific regulatory protein
MIAQLIEKQRNLELVAVYEISKILSSSLDLRKTLREVLNVLSAHLNLRRGMISLVQRNKEVHVVGAVGLTQHEIERGKFQRGEGITGRIVKTGLPMVVPDIAKEPLFLNRTGSRDLSDGQAIAFVGVPIKVSGEVIGVLSANREMNGHGGHLQHDVRFLKMVANLIGQTVLLQQSVAAEREQLMLEKHRLQKEVRPVDGPANVVGQSPRMREVYAEVAQAAAVNSNVLLRGESGTGKEMIAHAIHQMSARKNGPFIRVNCAALSETLLESELFGHEKGAFTGAHQERKGRFELAHGGTLFLDEIGDISPTFQAKLLRVIQEREFERVGGTKPIRVDVRLITATNRNLEDAVAKGEFRADLYFRINVISILLPPLRERREDIPLLVNHFLERLNRENHREVAVTPEVMRILTNCAWPGNVRELENCVERTTAMAHGKVIRDVDLPCQQGRCFSMALKHIWQIASPVPSIPQSAVTPPPEIKPSEPVTEPAGTSSQGLESQEFASERDRLIWALEQCGWVQAKAARLLNLTPRQIGYALQKYNISLKRL